jgi:hypothetical protein
MKPVLRIGCLLISTVVIQTGVAAQATNTDAVQATLVKIKELLAQHYKPETPPSVTARFVPIQFDSCELRWKLVSASGPFRYTTEATVNLADFDSTPPLVLMEKMPRTDRWAFELRTLNDARKVKVNWIVTEGSKIKDRREFLLSNIGFGADSQALAQDIANDFVSVIKQCSQRRAQQIVGREPR